MSFKVGLQFPEVGNEVGKVVVVVLVVFVDLVLLLGVLYWLSLLTGDLVLLWIVVVMLPVLY